MTTRSETYRTAHMNDGLARKIRKLVLQQKANFERRGATESGRRSGRNVWGRLSPKKLPMSNTILTKRLHISGLTPSFSAKDIQSRFEAFGKVSAVVGFGAVDANGDPKKFAYLTIEASKENIARCLGALSGTTWKGAKLRVGEARLDWKERLQKERETTNDSRPTKRPRLSKGTIGIMSTDMEPVSPLTAPSRTGWHITSDLHILRPMRLRPSRPLPPRTISLRKSTKKLKSKRKIRKRIPPTRAWPKKIDPREYGATHLKGEQLGNGILLGAGEQKTVPDENNRKEKRPSKKITMLKAKDEAKSNMETLSMNPSKESLPPTFLINDDEEYTISFEEEKQRNQNILKAILGDDSDWSGKETADAMPGDAFQENAEATGETDQRFKSSEEETILPSSQSESLPSVQTTKLKDMFKPREEEANFNLFGDLELDLDPEMQAVFSTDTTSLQPPSQALQPTQIQVTTVQHRQQMITLDPSLPFFFPRPGHSRDVCGILEAMVGGKFCRTESSDEIRERWDQKKVALTQEWKKRHREALKLRRLRVGAKDNND